MEPRAAPPDDGGERGAFTRPEETMEQPLDAQPDPRIARDVGPETRKGGSGTAWLVVTGVLLLVVLFAYCIAPASNALGGEGEEAGEVQ